MALEISKPLKIHAPYFASLKPKLFALFIQRLHRTIFQFSIFQFESYFRCASYVNQPVHFHRTDKSLDFLGSIQPCRQNDAGNLLFAIVSWNQQLRWQSPWHFIERSRDTVSIWRARSRCLFAVARRVDNPREYKIRSWNGREIGRESCS